MSTANPRRLRAPAVLLPLIVLVVAGGCWRLGEPTASPSEITWVAYPDTVQVGKVFSFEYAGPVSRDACARLDTSHATVTDSTVEIAGARSRFQTLCSDDRVSFYEAEALTIPRPGRYPVRASGREFGTLVAVEDGEFSSLRARGWGTLRQAGGCLFFGPGWSGNQRPFVLRGATERVGRVAETDTVVWVRGRISGFSQCGPYGSRPRIVVDSARVTDRTGADYYPGDSG